HDGRVRYRDFVGAVDYHQRNARACDERLQLCVSRRYADGEPAVGVARPGVYGAGGAERERIAADFDGAVLSIGTTARGGAVMARLDSPQFLPHWNRKPSLGPAGLAFHGAGELWLEVKLLSLRAEARQVKQAPFAQRKLKTRQQHAKAVFHAAAKIDGRSLFEILGRTGHLPNAEAEIHALGQHLVVEDEVPRVFHEGQGGQHFAAERAVAGVVFGELGPQKQVLEGRQEAVGNVFVEWHAAVQRPTAN